MKSNRLGSIMLSIFVASSTQVLAQDGSLQARKELANTALRQIKEAAQMMKSSCGLDVLDERRVPAEVDCGRGFESRGEAWNRLLANVGFPSTPQQRELAAQDLGLSSRTALVYYLGSSDPEKLKYLIAELERISREGS